MLNSTEIDWLGEFVCVLERGREETREGLKKTLEAGAFELAREYQQMFSVYTLVCNLGLSYVMERDLRAAHENVTGGSDV